MSTTATEDLGLSVGTAITSYAQLTALPVGAVLRAGGDYTLTKVSNLDWRRSTNGETQVQTSLSLNSYNVIESIPDEVAGPVIEVGTLVNSAEIRDALAVGTILHRPDREHDHTRYHVTAPTAPTGRNAEPYISIDHGDGRGPQASHPLSSTRVDGFLAVAELPTPPGPAVGDSITDASLLTTLPIGTIMVSSRTGTRYERRNTDDGARWYNLNTGRRHPTGRFSTGGALSIESIGEGQASESEPVPVIDYSVKTESDEYETLAMFKQRFRTTTFGAACRAGISRDPLIQAYRKLEVEEYDLSPGMVVSVHDSDLIDHLPHHTTVTQGNPKFLRAFAIHGRDPSRGWVRLLGQGTFRGVQRVLSIPDVERQPWLGTWTPEEEAAIRAFKAAAWQIGVQAKADNRWCGDYEQAMADCGINETVGTEQESAPLTPEEVAALPDGTILRFRGMKGSVLYLRDDRSTNPCKTVRLGGTSEGHWADRMIVVWREEMGACRVPVDSNEEMTTMAIGTVVCEEYSTSTWEKIGPDRWRVTPGGYEYDSASFGYSSLRYRTLVRP